MHEDTISLMLYDVREKETTIFYFLGLPIIKTLSEMPKTFRIKDLKLMASNCKLNYIYADDLTKKDTIKDLVEYFSQNTDYSIDDMDAILQNNIEIGINSDIFKSFFFYSVKRNFNI